MSDSTPDDDGCAGPVLARRALVRGAAHAAWVVPVVTVVTAAPALAASVPGTAANLVVTGVPVRNGTTLTITNGSIQNTGSTAAVDVEIGVIVNAQSLPVNSPDFHLTQPVDVAGTTHTNLTGSNSTGFIFSYFIATIGGGATLPFAPAFTLSPTPGPGQLNFTAQETGKAVGPSAYDQVSFV